MSKTITTRLERRVEADPSGMTVTDTTDGQSIMVALTRAQACELAAALDPERDFSGVDWKAMYEQAIRERDALDSQLTRVDMECAEAVTARVAAERTCDELRSLIEGQKEHVSKSIEVRDRMRRECDEALRKKGEMVDRAVRAERERDAAVARAETAEKRHTWPKTTPTGHTYVEPRTYEALRHEHDNAAQAEVECWAADECPPEPTWEMVGSAHREVERLQRERDEWKARAEEADREREEIADQFATFRADIVAEAVTARESAVTHADVEKALRASTNDVFQDESYPHMADAICDLFGIEAEQAEDPVESRARELYRAATPDARWETVADEYRRIAAHVLEQEAGSYA